MNLEAVTRAAGTAHLVRPTVLPAAVPAAVATVVVEAADLAVVVAAVAIRMAAIRAAVDLAEIKNSFAIHDSGTLESRRVRVALRAAKRIQCYRIRR